MECVRLGQSQARTSDAIRRNELRWPEADGSTLRIAAIASTGA